MCMPIHMCMRLSTYVGAIKALSDGNDARPRPLPNPTGSYTELSDPRLSRLQQAATASDRDAAAEAEAAAAAQTEAAAGVARPDDGGKENDPAQPAADAAACAPAAEVPSTVASRLGSGTGGARFAERLASLRARTLMSQRVKGLPAPPIVVKASDGEAEIEAAWDALKLAFGKERSAMIMHHKNHYALVFALRDYCDLADGRLVREVLTARKGQRPTAWVPYSEIHGLLAGWAGYAIIEVSGG